MKNTIKVLEYFKAGLSDVETSSGERQPMQDEIELALIEVKNNVDLDCVSNSFKDCECDNQFPQGMTMCINCKGQVR